MVITGTITNVYSRREEWAAAALESPDGQQQKIVGLLGDVVPGDHLRITGEPETGKYGPQIRVRGVERTRPAGARAIERWLSSIDGIGTTTAKRLVEAFGDDTLSRLAQSGWEEAVQIRNGQATAIQQAVASRTSRDDELLKLEQLVGGQALAQRLLKWAGRKSQGESPGAWVMKVLRNDPWQAQAVPGIGFKTADRIAGQLGVPKDHPTRLRAGIIHSLEEAEADGHTCLPQAGLLAAAAKLLEIPAENLGEALEKLVQRHRLVLDDDCAIRRYMHGLEERLAEDLAALAKAKTDKVKLVDPDGITLDPSQRAAAEAVLNATVSVLTGGPGTGKTTITSAIILSLERAEVRPIVLCSPTGKAAMRLAEATGREAKTIHRTLGCRPKSDGSGGWEFLHNSRCPLDAGVVVIDEATMVDTELFWRVVDALRVGTRLIVVGDLDQLPSVGPGRVFGDLIDSGYIPVARLTEVHRQKADSLIIGNARRILDGNPDLVNGPTPEADFRMAQVDDPDQARQMLVDIVARKALASYGIDICAGDLQVLAPMRKGSLGIERLNKELQAELNPSGQPIPKSNLRVGDRVINIANSYDPELHVMNGETGVITDFLTHKVRKKTVQEIVVHFDDGEVRVYPWSRRKLLAPAWAITTHKSQGSEWPWVVIVLHRQHYRMLQRDLFYTALTRARTKALVIFERSALKRAVKTVAGRTRHTRLIHRLEESFTR